MPTIIDKVNADSRLTEIQLDGPEIIRLDHHSMPILTTPATPTMGVTFVAGMALCYQVTKNG
ncbi:hypothetical protein OHR68_29495 [Spirillospora sp. NBC_00431]